MVKRFLGDSEENKKKYHKMWDDHHHDSSHGNNKKAKYDNMAYAGFEGLNGGATDWETNKGGTNNADWTDYNGYYGGHYGYGGWGGYGSHYGSGNRKNEEEDNWDDGSNDKEKEGYYPTRDEIKEDTRMLSKLKPDWLTNPWHYGYGHHWNGKAGTKDEEGDKKGEEKADDKAAI